MYYSSSPASDCKAVSSFEDQYLFRWHSMTLSAVVVFLCLNKLLTSLEPARLKLILTCVTKLAICH